MDKSDLKHDDFLEILGESIIKYKPTVTSNDVVKSDIDIDNGACEKLLNAHIDKDESTKDTENIEDSKSN